MKKGLLFSLLVCFGFGFVYGTSEPNIYAPVIISKYKNDRNVPKFEGLIREDETVVRLDPPLAALDNDTSAGPSLICGYNVTTTKHNIPFVVTLKDRTTGAAEIKLAEGRQLNYHKRQHYKFNIVAFDCAGLGNRLFSKRAVVSIKVEKDVENAAPVFDKLSYFVEIEEDQLYTSLTQLQAQGEVCDYKIITPDVPFVVDKEGNLQNTEKIEFSHRHNFILEVVARNCHGLSSPSVFVNVEVKETCKNGWKGFPESVDYTPGSGRQRIAEDAQLKICDEACQPDKIVVSMELATKHIGKGCDRDTYSITSQRKLCGASGDSIDLLPTPILTSNWTKGLPTDDGHEGDQVYAFDGLTNAVEVPRGLVDHQLKEHFTLSTWMKHQFPNTVVTNHRKGNKEHILCMSDGDGMDRRHYAWYIHNTKMEFLLRREAKDAKDQEVFKPAEFRWHLDDINDGDWHHYAISVDFPEVRLYVDGKQFVADKNNVEIIDDWPLHPTDRVHSTKLVIGACWEGMEKKHKGHFQGFLAGLSLLRDKTETDKVIECLNNCQESLDFHALRQMQSGTSVSFNKDMTVFKISGKNATEIEKLVREVSYVNARSFPTPGRRSLSMRTNVHCGTTEEILPLVEGYVMVGRSVRPVIKLTGKAVVQGTSEQLNNGINVLKDLDIHVEFYLPPGESPDVDDSEEDEDDYMYYDDDEEEDDDDDNDGVNVVLEGMDVGAKKADVDNTGAMKAGVLKETQKVATLMQESMLKSEQKKDVLLDVCTIKAEPLLNYYEEHLDIPEQDIQQFGMKLEGIETQDGVVILNADTVKHYLSVLRNMKYVHNEGKNFESRKLIVSCSSQNGRFISNELEIEVVLVQEEHKVVMKAHAQNNKLELESNGDLFQQFQHGGAAVTANTNFGMVAIIVVCVGFLLFMIVLGVLRIRAAHNKTRVVQVDDKTELDWDNWDNSELNITVNPIDREVPLFEYEENPMKSSLHDDSDTDDDISSFHDDHESSDEDETEAKTLEWDDSTLSY